MSSAPKRRRVEEDPSGSGGGGSDEDNNLNPVTMIAKFFRISERNANGVCRLFEEKCAIPYIVYFCTIITGFLSPEKLRMIHFVWEDLTSIPPLGERLYFQAVRDEHRKAALLKSMTNVLNVEEVKVMTPYCKSEFTFLPTASRAKEAGLEPVALALLLNREEIDLASYSHMQVEGRRNLEQIKTGVQDILLENFVNSIYVMNFCRFKIQQSLMDGNLYLHTFIPENDRKGPAWIEFKEYSEFSCSLKDLEPQQVLHINRGEREKVLIVVISGSPTNHKDFEKTIESPFLQPSIKLDKTRYDIFKYVNNECYFRYVIQRIGKHCRNVQTEKAEDGFIWTYGLQLKKWLLQCPIEGNVIVGIYTNLKRRCHLALLMRDNTIMDLGNISPTYDEFFAVMEKVTKATSAEISNIGMFAIGKSTESRRMERLIYKVHNDTGIFGKIRPSLTLVSQRGLDLNTAKAKARGEHPNIDHDFICAMGIAKRVRDPLTEVLKVDLDVMQYGIFQDDLPKLKLTKYMKSVAQECVCSVGVDINQAPPHILQYLPGVGSDIAEDIVKYRNENGKFKLKTDLKKVKGIGTKEFNHFSGFIKIFHEDIDADGIELLDSFCIRPEMYEHAKEVIIKERKLLRNMKSKEFCDYFHMLRSEIQITKADAGPSSAEPDGPYFSHYEAYAQKSFDNEFECKYGVSYRLSYKKELDKKVIVAALSRPFEYDIRISGGGPTFLFPITSIYDLKVDQILDGLILIVEESSIYIDVGMVIYGEIVKKHKKAHELVIGNWIEVKVVEVYKNKEVVKIEIVEDVTNTPAYLFEK